MLGLCNIIVNPEKVETMILRNTETCTSQIDKKLIETTTSVKLLVINTDNKLCTQENSCVSLFCNNFIKKKTLAQVFSCEFCKFSFFTEDLRATASG